MINNCIPIYINAIENDIRLMNIFDSIDMVLFPYSVNVMIREMTTEAKEESFLSMFTILMEVFFLCFFSINVITNKKRFIRYTISKE